MRRWAPALLLLVAGTLPAQPAESAYSKCDHANLHFITGGPEGFGRPLHPTEPEGR
ncbi:hypothetical protein [Notoacmeibacter marinus]|uniref:hypothetical protein n=1 Tax=Notoacmeibacter marinus TaxID=1876515 RepID=UPI001303769F|nr:hypothetical protein [Notoacmeibacter marinus]